MVNITSFTFPSSAGGTVLHGTQWTPDTAPRGVVQIAHGVAEHIGRYEDFARFLAQKGFVVVGHDHLGHGASLPAGGTAVYFADDRGWEHATDDIQALGLLVKAKYPGLPYFLLGHSMGSFLSRSLLIRYPGFVDGAILMGTGWNGQATITAGLALLGILAKNQGRRATSPLANQLAFGGYNKAFAPNRTNWDWITADPAGVAAYMADPLCGGDATIGLLQDLLGGLRFNQNRTHLALMDPDTPILLISGGDDPVGAMGKGVQRTRDAFAAAGVKDLTMTLYPGLRHEILNELGHRHQVYGDLLNWLEGHL